MLDKFDQLEKGSPDAVASLKKDGPGSIAAMNLKKAKRWPVFFNGMSPNGLICYSSSNDKALLPLDIVLGSLGIRFDLLNSDDAFTADVNGKKLVLDLGTGNASAGGASVNSAQLPWLLKVTYWFRPPYIIALTVSGSSAIPKTRRHLHITGHPKWIKSMVV
jgi:hypothetical protein